MLTVPEPGAVRGEYVRPCPRIAVINRRAELSRPPSNPCMDVGFVVKDRITVYEPMIASRHVNYHHHVQR